MAVLAAGESGWVISHEVFINNIYKRTNHSNEIKSYNLNPVLFDIRIPFVKGKFNCQNNGNESDEVVVCKKALKSLLSSYKAVCGYSTNKEGDNNFLAKSLADQFYCDLTRHPSSLFFGGNFSEEPLVSEIGKELYLIPEKSLFYCYDITQLSKHLKDKEFDFILMDPPWWNKYIRRKRKKNYKFGYDMVYDKDLSQIPISTFLSQEGILAIWCTSAPSHRNSILSELFPAWNIEYITQWFWLKITKLGIPICEFSNSSRKQPYERVIFGRKKNSVKSLPHIEKNKVIISVPSAIHSHKPPLCELLKPYLPEEPRCLELFARYLLPKWTSFGNEVLKLQHMSLYVEDKIQ